MKVTVLILSVLSVLCFRCAPHGPGEAMTPPQSVVGAHDFRDPSLPSVTSPLAADSDGAKKKEYILEGVYVPSGWEGDAARPQCAGVLTVKQDRNTVHAASCERWEYRPAKGGVDNWCAVAYQFPELNFGAKPGKNFRGQPYKHLVFWARGLHGNERVIFKALGGTPHDAAFPASADEISIGVVNLTQEWKQYSIDFDEHVDLSNVPSAFTWAVNDTLDPDGAVWFLEGMKLTE